MHRCKVQKEGGSSHCRRGLIDRLAMQVPRIPISVALKGRRASVAIDAFLCLDPSEISFRMTSTRYSPGSCPADSDKASMINRDSPPLGVAVSAVPFNVHACSFGSVSRAPRKTPGKRSTSCTCDGRQISPSSPPPSVKLDVLLSKPRCRRLGETLG